VVFREVLHPIELEFGNVDFEQFLNYFLFCFFRRVTHPRTWLSNFIRKIALTTSMLLASVKLILNTFHIIVFFSVPLPCFKVHTVDGKMIIK